VPVPPDGYGLYHCAVAGINPLEWLLSHDASGFPIGAARAAVDARAAEAVRGFILDVYRMAGRAEEAARLTSPGAAGYPGWYEMAVLSLWARGQVVVQTGDYQEAFGEGPLRLHILLRSVVDGAGVGTSHFELVQTWLPSDHQPPDAAAAAARLPAAAPAELHRALLDADRSSAQSHEVALAPRGLTVGDVEIGSLEGGADDEKAVSTI
jgi:hypothetical protein